MPPKREEKKEEKKENKLEKCGNCSLGVGNNDHGIQCEICDKWFHIKCQNISEDGYKTLSEISALHWFCQTCDGHFGKILPTLVKMSDRIDTMEIKMDKMRGDIEGFKTKMQKEMEEQKEEMESLRINLAVTEASLNEQNKPEVLEAKWTEVVKKGIDNKLQTVSQDIQEVQKVLTETKSQANEERDKESRRNNIIFYRVPESNAPNAEDRTKMDLDFCLALMNEGLEMEVTTKNINRVFRLGRKEQDRNRPLMVQLVDRSLKNEIMENLKKLRTGSDKFRDIVIAHDMTKAERLECKILVDQAKQQEADETSDLWIYRVRGLPGQMKIIKIKKRY
jgi:hypothetical protein